jgi:Phage tail lysozyme
MTETEYLMGLGWSREAANGICDHLTLTEKPLNICRWQGERLSKMLDWCSAREMGPSSLDAQLQHLHWELTNSYHKVGTAIRAAETVEEARKAFAPYSGAHWVKEGEIRWLTQEEAAT